jgi:dihydrofolate reductase
MGKLTVFNFVTLNGFFKGPNGDISWAHNREENDYAGEMLQAHDTLLFGRLTYELMESYWPTPEASKNSPEVAEGMNNADKIVFSRTLERVEWNNTRIVKDDIVEEIRKMKASGKGMTLLGSGSILTQFAEQGLIDEYQIMVHPVVLSEGTSILDGIKQNLNLELITTRTFGSSLVLLRYKPAEKEL